MASGNACVVLPEHVTEGWSTGSHGDVCMEGGCTAYIVLSQRVYPGSWVDVEPHFFCERFRLDWLVIVLLLKSTVF